MSILNQVSYKTAGDLSYRSTFAEKLEKTGDFLLSPLTKLLGYGKNYSVKIMKSDEGAPYSASVQEAGAAKTKTVGQKILGWLITIVASPFIGLGAALKKVSLYSTAAKQKHDLVKDPQNGTLQKEIVGQFKPKVQTRLDGQQGYDKQLEHFGDCLLACCKACDDCNRR